VADLAVTIGGRAFPLVAYGADCWRARDVGGLFVQQRGRTWRIALHVHGLTTEAVGSSLAAAEAALDQKLEPLRLLLGGSSA
jgi:hypothetical protein